MYPFLRHYQAIAQARRMGPIGPFETHVSQHRIWPTDIDPWMELNNGRTLTLYDLGRIPLFIRLGIVAGARKAGLYFTVAGVSVRYRARLQPFRTVEMRTRMLGWDGRFIYMDQSLWLDETACANQVLVRSAIARRGKGIVPPGEALRLMGFEIESPPLPGWVENWIAAEGSRPWPPERV